MRRETDTSRRAWLKRAVRLGGVVALYMVADGALAEGAQPATPTKASQAAVQYQNDPKDGKMCANCRFFIPDGPGGGRGMMGGMMGGGMMGGMHGGTCQVVEGRVSPMGYCIVYAPPTPPA